MSFSEDITDVSLDGASRIETNPLRLQSLNGDVLSHITSFLTYPDALSLLCTCKAISRVSIDPALHTVVLGRSSAELLHFRDFLLAKTSRALFVKSLKITKTVTWDLDSKDIARALADVLEKTTRLEAFSCGAMRELITVDSRIKENLIYLTELRELTLLEGGPEIVNIATSSKSITIEQLTLDLLFHANKVTFEDFFGQLSRHRRLTHLSISRMYDRIIIPPNWEPALARARMPSVRNLTFTCTYIPLALASAAFPNVTRLHFSNARHYPKFGPVRVQKPVDVTPCWPMLEDAQIDARDLEIWPVASATRRLDLDVLRGGYSVEALTAVERMNPWVLACAYTIDADNLFWVRLPIIATELRFLDVRVLELSGSPRKYMLMHLTRLPALTVLFVCIRAFHQPMDPAAEIAALARQFGQHNSKLRFVGLSFADGRSMREDEPVFDEERLGSTWFEIRREKLEDIVMEDGAMVVDDWEPMEVVAIPTAVGLKVRDYMYEADYDAPGWEDRLSTFS
ncbi:uncharacterized protein TRAVEDRAFT_70802 [Trametes versicolor FP-101664 SS1]|uniref:uncharacterized protein n=1 Tax=Trametes versicolor (strain FP-101664) TaxID=717944 RepID=UPI000462219F|nr:uncharacterized protein TRAVEDRAFT_70802 [Trametes versicolor FP-101664 SS1]EIW60400.1 hypothetical protein TRAVEDRAFT_70802 [Trametes versicolor FP-101664 SS1]